MSSVRFSLKRYFAVKNPAYAILMLGMGMLILFVPLPFTNPEPQHRTIHIEASQYAFTPGEVHINPGDQVTIEFVSTDVVHGFSLDGHDVQVTAEPGRMTSVTFIAGPAGTYRFRCSVACGNMHPFMIGKMRIGTNPLWIRGSIIVLAVIILALFSRNRDEAQA